MRTIRQQQQRSYAQLWFPAKEWGGGRAFLIGGGPSLRGFDFSLLKPEHVIGANDAFSLGGDIVKYCVFGDANWWQHNKFKLETFTGRVVSNAPSLIPMNVPYLLKTARQRDGIHSGTTLGWNYSTGALAINLAISLGAVSIYLLGYDLCNQHSKSHWHDHNPKTTQEFTFKRFLRGFQCVKSSLPEGVKVINVTDGTSRLDCFEKMEYAQLFSMLLENQPTVRVQGIPMTHEVAAMLPAVMI